MLPLPVVLGREWALGALHPAFQPWSLHTASSPLLWLGTRSDIIFFSLLNLSDVCLFCEGNVSGSSSWKEWSEWIFYWWESSNIFLWLFSGISLQPSGLLFFCGPILLGCYSCTWCQTCILWVGWWPCKAGEHGCWSFVSTMSYLERKQKITGDVCNVVKIKFSCWESDFNHAHVAGFFSFLLK